MLLNLDEDEDEDEDDDNSNSNNNSNGNGNGNDQETLSAAPVDAVIDDTVKGKSTSILTLPQHHES